MLDLRPVKCKTVIFMRPMILIRLEGSQRMKQCQKYDRRIWMCHEWLEMAVSMECCPCFVSTIASTCISICLPCYYCYLSQMTMCRKGAPFSVWMSFEQRILRFETEEERNDEAKA